jgi:LAO/AO transport system kinase
VTCSALENVDLDRVWKHVLRHRAHLEERGEFEAKRTQQLVEWTRAMVRDRLLSRLDSDAVRTVAADVEAAVVAGDLTPDQAAHRVIDAVDHT